MKKDDNNHNCECGSNEEHNCGSELDEVTLTTDNGEELNCDVLGIFELEEKEYIALLPEGEDEVVIFKYIEQNNGEVELDVIDSPDEQSQVSNKFNEIFCVDYNDEDYDDEDYDDEDYDDEDYDDEDYDDEDYDDEDYDDEDYDDEDYDDEDYDDEDYDDEDYDDEDYDDEDYDDEDYDDEDYDDEDYDDEDYDDEDFDDEDLAF